MSNVLVSINPGIPSFLAALSTKAIALNSDFMSGISAGGQAHAKISIRGSKFALVSADNERQLVNSLSLNVILVGANPALTKAWYATAFDPSVENKAPDCFSNDGKVPSEQSTNKQASVCALCPHNAWGSGRGKGKACQDNKRLAVVLADSEDDRVFELKLPPTSLKAFGNYVKELELRKTPVAAVTTALEFQDAEYPTLDFTATGWAPTNKVARVVELLGGDEVKHVIGTMDNETTQDITLAQTPLPPRPTPALPAAEPIEPEPAKPAPKPKAKAKAASFLDDSLPAEAPRPVDFAPTTHPGKPSPHSGPSTPVVLGSFSPTSNTDALAVPQATNADMDAMLDSVFST